VTGGLPGQTSVYRPGPAVVRPQGAGSVQLTGALPGQDIVNTSPTLVSAQAAPSPQVASEPSGQDIV
jgi:hypothetical protein